MRWAVGNSGEASEFFACRRVVWIGTAVAQLKISFALSQKCIRRTHQFDFLTCVGALALNLDLLFRDGSCDEAGGFNVALLGNIALSSIVLIARQLTSPCIPIDEYATYFLILQYGRLCHYGRVHFSLEAISSGAVRGLGKGHQAAHQCFLSCGSSQS